jgi:glycosyltransferase involved in cell wall biosynthesis
MTPQSMTIVMPVFNEAATLRVAVERLLAVDLPVQRDIVIVDDGSTDGCMATITDLIEGDPTVRTFRQEPNQGKGAALRRGFDEANGDLLTILDADLEYDPEDFVDLLQPILHEDARVVYGTRSFGSNAAYSFWYVMGNKLVAFWASLVFNAWLSDVETCLKVAPTSLWREIRPRSSGFGIEAEVTGGFLRRGERIYEVPISYKARSREEGKKITWVDGVEALWILLRVRLLGR